MVTEFVRVYVVLQKVEVSGDVYFVFGTEKFYQQNYYEFEDLVEQSVDSDDRAPGKLGFYFVKSV